MTSGTSSRKDLHAVAKLKSVRQVKRPATDSVNAMTDNSPLRVAIVGAGPSGFYAAGHLLALNEPQFAVDL